MSNETTSHDNGVTEDPAAIAAAQGAAASPAEETATPEATPDVAAEPEAVKVPSFDDLGLHPDIKQALDEMGYFLPTPVQSAVYVPVSEGKDLLVQSRTGTGKTTAFGLPTLSKIVPTHRQPQALILAPTRELALQVARELTNIGKHRGIVVEAIYGGAPIAKQIANLKNGVHVVVGTPGRVLDHIGRRTLDTKTITTFILDECDEMLSMGFLEDIERVVKELPEKKQTLLFSATMPEEVARYSRRHMVNPVQMSLSRDGQTVSDIHHAYYIVSGIARSRDLLKIIYSEEPESAIIFCNMRDETTMVAKVLQKQGLDAEALSSDLSQNDRERVMGRMKAKNLRFLCATDVAARGIDISNLSHVINYSVPESPESYVHRTGRTGRAGRKGVAISMVGPRELGNFRLLRLTYGLKPEERVLPKDDIFEGKLKVALPPVGVPKPPDPVQILIRGVPQQPSELEIKIFENLYKTAAGKRVLAALVAERLDKLSTRTKPKFVRPERTEGDVAASGGDAPREERPSFDRGERSFDRDRGPRSDGPRHDGPRSDGPRSDGDRPRRFDRPDGDRPRRFDRDDRPRRFDGPDGERPRGDRPEGAPAGDRPVGDRPVGDRPVGDRPEGDRPRRFDRDRPDGDRPRRFDRDDRPRGDRPEGAPNGASTGDRPEGDRPRGDRPEGDRPRRFDRDDRPRGDRPEGAPSGTPTGDRKPDDGRARSNAEGGAQVDRPEGDRPRGDRPEGDRPRGDRERRPWGERGEGRRYEGRRDEAPAPAGDAVATAPAGDAAPAVSTDASPTNGEARPEGERQGRDRDRGDRGGRDRGDRGGRFEGRGDRDRNRDRGERSGGNSDHLATQRIETVSEIAPAATPAPVEIDLDAAPAAKVDDVAARAVERADKKDEKKPGAKRGTKSEPTAENREFWETWAEEKSTRPAPAPAPAAAVTADAAPASTDEDDKPRGRGGRERGGRDRGGRGRGRDKAEAAPAEKTEAAPAAEAKSSSRTKRDTTVTPPPVATADGAQARLFVSLGKKQGVSADDLRALLSKPLGGDTAQIGSISLRDSHAHVRVPEAQVDAIIKAVHGTQHNDHDVTVERARA